MPEQSLVGGLHIGTLARRVGMTPDTVRYYERLGLLRRPARADNGYRVYGTTDVGRLLFVRRAKLLGMPLGQIRELVALAEEGRCQPVRHRVVELLQAMLAEYETRLTALRAFKANLEERYELALQQEDDSELICATFPTSCDCLPVALHEMESLTRGQSGDQEFGVPPRDAAERSLRQRTRLLSQGARCLS